MKLLKSVELRNYKSHENTKIEFGKLTSIIGENDQGKSNVYRGIAMVLLNQPFKETHIRYGTKEGSVKITFTDGSWIERARKGAKQTCTLSTNPSKPYETIRDITEIVQEFTGFKPITIDKNSKPESVQLIPISGGQSFLIEGVSPDGVMRRINRLMSGSGIETARITLEKELRAIEKSNSVQEAELEKQSSIMQALQGPDWDVVTDQLVVTTAKIKECQRLDGIITTLEGVKGISEMSQHLEEATNAFGDTLDRLPQLRAKMQKLKEAEAMLSRLDNWNAELIKRMVDLNHAYDQQDEITALMDKLKPQLEAAREELYRQKQQEELSKQAVCPTCKRPL